LAGCLEEDKFRTMHISGSVFISTLHSMAQNNSIREIYVLANGNF